MFLRNFAFSVSVFFFLRFSLHRSLKRLEPFHYYFLSLSSFSFSFQPSDQTIFLTQTSGLGHGTRLQQQSIRSAPDQTITPANQMSLRSRPQIRPCTNSHTRPSSDQTTKISPSDQTTTAKPDHQIRSAQQATILDCSTSNQHSTPNLVKWYRSGALFVGWVKGGI